MARVLRIADETAGVLDKIADDVFDHSIDPEELAKVLARQDHLLFVALDGDTVVGQCLGMVLFGPDRAPSLYIDNLGVAPSHQRQGIATQLMKAVTEAGKARGATVLWLGTDPDSDSALPFYRALGFEFKTTGFTEVEL